jgi:hypothetical protein
MSDQDDLPPEAGRDARNGSFAEQLGSVFGGVIMLAIVFAVVGIVAYALLHWIH